MTPTADTVDVLRTPGDVAAPWLTTVLRRGVLPAHARVTGATVTPVGTGQMADTVRIAVDYDPPGAGPATLVGKFASSDPASRGAGMLMRAYEIEVAVYATMPPLPGVPRCHHASIEPTEGWFTLLLDDVAPAAQGDDVAGCDLPVAEAALRRLAAIHAAGWDDQALAGREWLNRHTPEQAAATAGLLGSLAPLFLERFHDRVVPAHADLLRRLVPRLAQVMTGDGGPRTLAHGDYRLDNMLFRPGSPDPTVVDWQTAVWGSPAGDVAYFLGGSLLPQTRREQAEHLLDVYHEALVAAGVAGYGRDRLTGDVRRHSFGGLLQTFAAAILVQATDRGDAFFAEAYARHAQHVLDADAEALLPATATAHEVAPADEGPHRPGPEELWNESWYADVVSADGRVAAYVRLGLYPNLGRAWWHLVVVGPGRPLVRYAATDLALPADPTRLDAPGLRVELVPSGDLTGLHVRAELTAHELAGPQATSGDAGGRPVPVTLDASWRTEGRPYHYDAATRYEVPCRVEGSLTVDGEALDLAGPGQRDHSWGVRDWWSFGWVWAAAAFADGERVQVTDVRLPGLRLPFGYVQRDGEVTPVASLAVDEVLDADGLPSSCRIVAQGHAYDVDQLRHGPIELPGPDGQVGRLLRASARFTASDGRRGTGWVEWNLPA